MGLYSFYKKRLEGEEKFYDYIPPLVEKKYLKTVFCCFERCAKCLKKGDLDGDGQEDLMVMNYAQDYNTIYKNEGGGFFSDITQEVNMTYESFHQLSWSNLLLDVEFDGDLDVFIANGHVMPQIDQTDATKFKQKKLCSTMEKPHLTTYPTGGRGISVELSSGDSPFGDLDGRRLDIVLATWDDHQLFMKLNIRGNNWIGIESGRDGI
jgi:hypothetical protein